MASEGDAEIGAMHRNPKCWEFGNRSNDIEVGHVDVSEVFSLPRVAAMATNMGLQAGTSMDITTTDDNGEPWNFSIKRMRDKAEARVKTEKPLLLVGSPVCTMFSQLMNVDKAKMDPLEYQARLREARIHLQFVCKLYQLQHDAGRYFHTRAPPRCQLVERALHIADTGEDVCTEADGAPVHVWLEIYRPRWGRQTSKEANHIYDELSGYGIDADKIA